MKDDVIRIPTRFAISVSQNKLLKKEFFTHNSAETSHLPPRLHFPPLASVARASLPKTNSHKNADIVPHPFALALALPL